MLNKKIFTLLGLVFLTSGCEQYLERELPTIDQSLISETDNYIDGIDLYLAEQYRMTRDFLKRENLLSKETIDSNSETDQKIWMFGSETNCSPIILKFLEIQSIISEASDVFEIIIDLLDESDISFTFENYKKSIASREYIKCLISHISRYIKTVQNGINTVILGIQIDDKDMISEGFDILSTENKIFANINHEYNKLVPMLHAGITKNLHIFFREVAKDIPELRAKVKDINENYNSSFSLSVDKKYKEIFEKNTKNVNNVSENIKRSLNFLLDLKDYCAEKRIIFSNI